MPQRAKPIARTPEAPLPEAALRRRWEHALHEDSLFHQRMAFFAATEGLFLVALTTLWAEGAHWALVITTGGASALFALFWLRIQRRQWKYIAKISHLLEYDAAEFNEDAYADRGMEDPEDSTRDMAVWLPVGFIALATVLTLGFLAFPKSLATPTASTPPSQGR